MNERMQLRNEWSSLLEREKEITDILNLLMRKKVSPNNHSGKVPLFSDGDPDGTSFRASQSQVDKTLKMLDERNSGRGRMEEDQKRREYYQKMRQNRVASQLKSKPQV
jgi:hypothetical protein